MSRLRTNRWFAFAALSLIFFVVSAGAFSSLGVVLPAMVAEMHWNWTQAGLGYTLLGLACGLASLAPTALIRWIGVRGSMIAGAACLAIGFGAMALAHTLGLYLAATVLIGIAFALVSTVPGTHVLTDLFENRSTMLGAYFTIGALGQVAGPLFYVLINHATHGWRSYWVAFVLLALISGLFAIITTPGRDDQGRHVTAAPEQAGPIEMLEGLKDWTVRRALATPQFYIVVAGYTTYQLLNTTAHGFAVEHLTERGVSSEAAAAMLSIEALIGAAVSVLGGFAGEKVSPKVLMIVSLVSLTLGMGGLAQATDWTLMWVYAVGVGIGFGLSLLAATMLLYQYFGKRPNLELFSIMCLISTSAAIGPTFGGWARDTLGSFTGMFWLCAAATGLLTLVTLLMRAPAHRAASAAVTLGEGA